MRPLTPGQYAKTNFRRRMRELPYPEKVKCVIRMQKRLVPILAARGIAIRPWKEDGEEEAKEKEKP